MTKGQEALQELFDDIKCDYHWDTIPDEYCDKFVIIEKELKVFNLLKEAYHCRMFYVSTNDWKNPEEKVKYMILPGDENTIFFITKKEFNLIKEVLK